MKCAICKGILNPIKDELIITIEGQDILISHIEMLECQNCGKSYLTLFKIWLESSKNLTLSAKYFLDACNHILAMDFR